MVLDGVQLAFGKFSSLNMFVSFHLAVAAYIFNSHASDPNPRAVNSSANATCATLSIYTRPKPALSIPRVVMTKAVSISSITFMPLRDYMYTVAFVSLSRSSLSLKLILLLVFKSEILCVHAI